jgi:beta-lactamase regulating signal transducer with metallopeptidase domain
MNFESVAASSMSFLTHLIEPALRSLLLAAVAGILVLGLRIYGVKSRLAVWRIVLCAALAMPVLSYVMPSMPVSARFLTAIPAIGERLEAAVATAGPADSGVVDAVPTPVGAVTSNSVAVAHFATNQIDLHRVKDAGRSVDRADQRARRKTDAEATGHYEAGHAIHPASPSVPAQHFWSLGNAPTSLVVLYLALAAVFVARMFAGIFLGAHLDCKAHTIRDQRAMECLEGCAIASGLNVPPRLAESEALSVPVTFGVTHPSILVPVSWREWSEDEFSSVLFHEMSHIVRRDALTERLSLLHRAIFWFSPLSWWLDGKLAQLAEEASDEAALASGIDRTRYAETLLNFFRALETAPGRVWWQGVSMAAAGQAEKRVDRILRWNGDSGMKVKKPVIAVAIGFAIPLVALASAITPRFERTHVIQEAAPAPAQQAAPPVRPAAPPAVAPTTVITAPDASYPVTVIEPMPVRQPAPKVNVKVDVTPHVAVDSQVHVSAVANPDATAWVEAAPKAFVVAPVVAIPPKVYVISPNIAVAPHVSVVAPTALQDNRITVTNGKNGEEFVIVTGGSSFVVINPGEHGEVIDGDDAADVLREKYGDNFIWFRRAGKAYVITDPQTIQRVKAAYDAIDLIGKKQAALGEQQAAIGEQQAAIGQLMSGVSINVPDLSAQMKAIEDQMKSLESDSTRKAMAEAQANLDAAIAKLDVNSPQMAESLAKLQAEAESLHTDQMAERLSQMQEKLGELQEKLGEAQSGNGESAEKLSKLESELGAKEEALGKKESELGKQEEAASKDAERQVRQILNEAISKGLAKPE